MRQAMHFFDGRRVSALALALVLTATLAAPGQAETKNLWNPVTWFNGTSAEEQAVQAAEKRAEEARQTAERALREAREAQARAIEAQRAAKELKAKQTPTASAKPVVAQPETELTETTPNFTTPEAQAEATAKEPARTAAHEEANAPPDLTKNTLWNPMSLFKRGHSSTNEETPAEAKPAQTANQAKETQPDKEGGAWNLMGLFHKESSETAAATQTKEPAQPVVDPAIRTQAALIETEKGKIAIELYPDEAPVTVSNFVKLVNDGFYNKFNMKFHRVIPGFVVQTGDPTGTGAGGSKDRIPLEAKNKLSHDAKGVVSMARGPDPNSASSQFYITLAPQTSLDGKYAIFGRVIGGIDVLDKIEKDDMLYGIRMVDLKSVQRDEPPEKKKFFSNLF